VPAALGYNLTLTYQLSPRLIPDWLITFGCQYSGSVLSPLNSATCLGRGGRVLLFTNDTATALFTFRTPVLAMGERIHCIFAGTVRQTVQPLDDITNPVTLTYFSTPATLARGLSQTSSTSMTVPPPVLVWTMPWSMEPSTSSPFVTIEEDFTLVLNTTMPEVTTDTTITIQVPSNLLFLNASIYWIGANLNSSIVVTQVNNALPNFAFSGSTLTATFGMLRNLADNVTDSKDVIQIGLQLRTRNISANTAGVFFDDVGTIFFNSGRTRSSAFRNTVAEPRLINSISTTVLANQPDAGDRLTHNANVGPQSSGCNAYQVSVVEPHVSF
jgi:hypothetical protein